MRFLIRIVIIVVLIMLVWRLARALMGQGSGVEVIPPRRDAGKRRRSITDEDEQS